MQPQCNPSSALFAKVGRRWHPACTVALAGLLLAALPGCWKARSFVEPPPPKPYAGVTLTLVCPGGAVARRDLLDQLARDWSARTGARLELLPDGEDRK